MVGRSNGSHPGSGYGMVNTVYWDPMRLAGEAAMLDLIPYKRLELGPGSSAFLREVDRMKTGLLQKDGYRLVGRACALQIRLFRPQQLQCAGLAVDLAIFRGGHVHVPSRGTGS